MPRERQPLGAPNSQVVQPVQEVEPGIPAHVTVVQGGTPVPVTVEVDESGLATNSTLIEVRNAVTALNAFLDGLETNTTGLATQATLALVKTALDSVISYVDGIEAALAATLKVKDDYEGGECLAEQTGAGGVLTFTFSSAVQLVLIEAVGTGTQVARVDPFGGTPTASLGIRAGDGVPTYVPVTCTVVKVFAPSGMVVAVNGFRRA